MLILVPTQTSSCCECCAPHPESGSNAHEFYDVYAATKWQFEKVTHIQQVCAVCDSCDARACG
eukprot:m.190441 g.190441  ORF g.190441 m.190441 type:complete len:63 (+) comp14817_c0_seq6:1548-1736(+)